MTKSRKTNKTKQNKTKQNKAQVLFFFGASGAGFAPNNETPASCARATCVIVLEDSTRQRAKSCDSFVRMSRVYDGRTLSTAAEVTVVPSRRGAQIMMRDIARDTGEVASLGEVVRPGHEVSPSGVLL